MKINKNITWISYKYKKISLKLKRLPINATKSPKK